MEARTHERRGTAMITRWTNVIYFELREDLCFTSSPWDNDMWLAETALSSWGVGKRFTSAANEGLLFVNLLIFRTPLGILGQGDGETCIVVGKNSVCRHPVEKLIVVLVFRSVLLGNWSLLHVVEFPKGIGRQAQVIFIKRRESSGGIGVCKAAMFRPF